jgi:hypothetical protein
LTKSGGAAARWESTPCQGRGLARAVTGSGKIHVFRKVVRFRHTPFLTKNGVLLLFVYFYCAFELGTSDHFLVTVRRMDSVRFDFTRVQRWVQTPCKDIISFVGRNILFVSVVCYSLQRSWSTCCNFATLHNFSFADMLESGRLLNNILFCSLENFQLLAFSGSRKETILLASLRAGSPAGKSTRLTPLPPLLLGYHTISFKLICSASGSLSLCCLLQPPLTTHTPHTHTHSLSQNSLCRLAGADQEGAAKTTPPLQAGSRVAVGGDKAWPWI